MLAPGAQDDAGLRVDGDGVRRLRAGQRLAVEVGVLRDRRDLVDGLDVAEVFLDEIGRAHV